MGSMTQFSSEHSKESPRWLRDLLSLFHNNIAQTQRLSGTLAVMANAIGKAYFMRRRFLLYRISCRGMQRMEGHQGNLTMCLVYFHGLSVHYRDHILLDIGIGFRWEID